MKATVYVDAINRKGLIAENVKILELSEAPRITKKGKVFKQPFAGSKYMTPYQISVLRLWEQGVRKAEVIYPDGTSDVEVWVNIKDIEEDKPEPKMDYFESMERVRQLSQMDGEAF